MCERKSRDPYRNARAILSNALSYFWRQRVRSIDDKKKAVQVIPFSAKRRYPSFRFEAGQRVNLSWRLFRPFSQSLSNPINAQIAWLGWRKQQGQTTGESYISSRRILLWLRKSSNYGLLRIA